MRHRFSMSGVSIYVCPDVPCSYCTNFPDVLGTSGKSVQYERNIREIGTVRTSVILFRMFVLYRSPRCSHPGAAAAAEGAMSKFRLPAPSAAALATRKGKLVQYEIRNPSERATRAFGGGKIQPF